MYVYYECLGFKPFGKLTVHLLSVSFTFSFICLMQPRKAGWKSADISPDRPKPKACLPLPAQVYAGNQT